MKIIRYLTMFGGLVSLALAIGFVFQSPVATGLWPWPDGRLSYLFIGSILAAISASMLWIGWSGEFAAFAGGTLNIFVISATTSFYLFRLAIQDGRPNTILFAIAALIAALASGAVFLWSRRLPLADQRRTPPLVRVSFGIFIAALLLAGGALVLRSPIFPWAVNPDSSVMFGCFFFGNACYFLYGLLRPIWHNALGQLLSFLAYDLVLIVPFMLLFKTAAPGYMLSLLVYIAVLLYSGGIAVYFLFVNGQTRLGS